MSGDVWEVRTLHGGLTLELHGGDNPGLVLVRDNNRVKVELANVKVVVAAMVGAAVDLVEALAAGGVYHA